ncbi:DNA/RNA non-specific endonuclease, partial [Verrucomicrobiota bacterium]
MTKKKQPTRRLRKIKYTTLALLIYALCALYIHLPERAREPIWKNVRGLNKQLCTHGNAICNLIDNLKPWGHDQAVAIERPYGDDQIYGGRPKQKLTALHRATLLKNSGYTVGYSDHFELPLWSAYRVFNVPKLESGKRPSRFTTDTRTKARVSHNDYTRSGFDRGHMAPNYAIATRYGRTAQKETFLMSNIIP